MKKLLLILLCLPMIGFGQGWEKNFGGISWDRGKSVLQTSDGGFITLGDLNTSLVGSSTTTYDAYLIKTDANGDSLWTRTFGGVGNEYGNCIQNTNDGGYIITGWTNSFGNGMADLWLIKVDSTGIEQWNQTFGGPDTEMGYSVQQTTDGGYIITGKKYTGWPGNGYDVYLLKTDSNGIEQWSQTFGNAINYPEWGNSVQQTTDGGYIITGQSASSNADGEVCLIKTDSLGTQQWIKTFGGTIQDEGRFVQQTTDGGYIITGITNNSGYKMYLIKTDVNGDSLWTRTFGDVNNDSKGNSVQQTTDGGYIITGEYNSTKLGLIKTDSIGVEQWTQTFGTTFSSANEGFDVKQTTDGGYIISGQSGLNGRDVYLIKTDDYGCTSPVIWQQAFTICNGDSVMVGTSVYDTTGNYTDTLSALNSCDSIVHTNISYEVCGCTNPVALNYNISATLDDGSCLFQQTFVPDDNFEAYLEANSMGNNIPNDDSVLTANIMLVTNLDVSFQNIYDLTGIEDFSSLINLDLEGNFLSNLNISDNISLTDLNCRANQLTSIDLSNNSALYDVEFSFNQLTNIDFSNNPALYRLDCTDNQLVSLDFSNNPALGWLDADNNNVDTLNVNGCANLVSIEIINNQLNHIQLNGTNSLVQLFCENNQLTSLDLSQSIALQLLTCQNNQINSLNLVNNISLNHLWCQDNNIDGLDLSNAINFSYLFCQNNQLAFLNLKNGNNQNWGDGVVNGTLLDTRGNNNLYCISVDDSTWSTNNWTFFNQYYLDFQHYFSNNCSGATAIEDHTTNKKFLRTIDVLGRETKGTKNEVLFYIYDDGTVEKRIIIE